MKKIYPDVSYDDDETKTHPWRLQSFEGRGSSPNVDAHARDLMDGSTVVNRQTILADYGPETRKAALFDVYVVFADLRDLPGEVVHDESTYEWSELSIRRRPFPAPKIFIPSKKIPGGAWSRDDGKARVVDGNHRLRAWRAAGYDAALVWVIQEVPLKKGSRSKDEPTLEAFGQRGADHDLNGIIHPSFEDAIEDILNGMIQEDLYDMAGVPAPKNSKEAVRADKMVRAWLKARIKAIGIPQGPALALEVLYIERRARGRGLGREIVRRTERTLKEMGAKSIVLQSGEIDDAHSAGFWSQMGYKEWPMRYKGEDRVHFKVIK
jgi:GNAT superfamily N-acetyltransferase